MSRFPRPIIFTNATIIHQRRIPLGHDQCESCKSVFENSQELVRMCFRCHRVLCFKCCPKIICPECIEKKEQEEILMKCKHKWEREEYRNNQHRFIEIFWCCQCGAIKRKEFFQGGKKIITIKLPKNHV